MRTDKVGLTYCLLAVFFIGLTFSGELSAETAYADSGELDLEALGYSLASQDQTTVLSRANVVNSDDVRQVKLSPNGRYVTFLKRDTSQKSSHRRALKTLWLRHIKSGAQHKLITSPKMSDYEWSPSQRFIFVYSQDFVSVIDLGSGNDIINFNTIKKARLLHKLDRKMDEYFHGINPNHDNALVLASRDPANGVFAFDQIDANGLRTRIYESTQTLLGLVTHVSQPAKPAFIKLSNKGEASILDVRDLNASTNEGVNKGANEAVSEGKKGKIVLRCPIIDPCVLQAFNEDTQQLFLLGRFGNELIGLYALDTNKADTNSVDDSGPHPNKQKVIENINNLQRLHQDPGLQFDIQNVFFTDNTPEVVSYNTYGKHYYGLSERAKQSLSDIYQHFETRKAQFNGKYVDAQLNTLFPEYLQISASLNMQRWLVTDLSSDFGSQLEQNRYSIYSSKNTSKGTALAPLLVSSQALVARQPSIRFVFEYAVSDGMQQFAYVTVPRGYQLNTLPLIVKPHGGPWSRTQGRYDTMSDFIASRGYAVFEPNFRSSTGMGESYMTSANKDFGNGIVQQDIIDGMHALLAQGVGDKNQLGLVGHSFGGFSALAGLSFTPNLFKMAFAGAPPSDLVYSIEFLARKDIRNLNIRREIRFSTLAVDIKDDADKARLSAISPAESWRFVNKPLTIWAGEYDDRVNIKKVQQYSAKVYSKAETGNFSLFVDPYSGHSPSSGLAREAYYYLVEQALYSVFKKQFEQQKSEQLSRYLKVNTVLQK